MDASRTSQIMTAIQHISESVFVKLCQKVGTSQLVAMRRDVMDISRNQVTTCDHELSMMLSGSYREGFRFKDSDVDQMFWPNNHRVIWELSQCQYYETPRKTLIFCDCSESPPGFTLLYLLSPSMDPGIQRACVRMKNRQYISSAQYRQITCSTSNNTTPHGPCASAILVGGLECDIAPCFVCDFWPQSAFSWIERSQSWPQPYIVADIIKNGCHFVAVGHKLGNHEANEWRISFSLAEQKLVYAMNHCQFLTYGLLKLFLSEIINNGLGDDEKVLCSYHMKTAVFWVIQQNTISHWCPQNLLECFWVCFKLILKWVYEGVCPNFFIPGNNMFLSNIHGETQNRLFIRLYRFYEKGLSSLLHSPSIRSCIIDVLYNPILSICTDEHTLISETEFDVRLFKEIYSYDTLHSINLQGCMSCLHIIEQMIDSPLRRHFQVITLQKRTAYVLHKLAFILHMRTCTFANKLRNRADKICCHMLKLAAKFGCISDMLYLTMYYYKTLRYTEALSIIQVIKVKLARPYVMHRLNVDAQLYTEAVGGQSWSTKMRQAVAMDIKLHSEIHYISELIPEQHSDLRNNESSFLLIPHFILLHMLEILCYRNVDSMRAQTALDDLQTLVHYDQGVYVPLLLRDISWQILGICQQVTGNLQDALYSYQQSLRQKRFNKIQTATEMRIQGIRQ